MARRIRNVFDRRAAIGVALALILAAAFFTSAAIYSVHQRAAQTQQTCNAVKGLRDDLVAALTKIEDRAMSGAQNEAQKKLIKEAYQGKDGLITIIGNPKCP